MRKPRIVVIGAGHAAVRAALSMRDAGFDGTITMVADDGSNAPYERPHLSKWAHEIGVPIVPIVPPEKLVATDLIRVNAKVESIRQNDHTVKLTDGSTLPYARLLIATGARARRLERETFGDVPVYYVRNLEDAEMLRLAAQSARNAVIIGGGIIGLELAASLRGMDVNVHIVELADRLLARAVTASVAQIVHDLHVEHGVTFTFNAKLVLPQKLGSVVLEDGSEFPADLLIAGIGSIPNIELGEDAGLAVENGIAVDDGMRTSVPDIFAAGDCCAFPLYGALGRRVRLESWQVAGDQGAVAGQNMVSDDEVGYTRTPWFWSHQYDHVLQVSGVPAPSINTERAYAADHHVSFGSTEEGKLRFACGIAPGTKVAKDIRFAAKIIEAGIQVAPTALADTQLALKSLLRG